MAVFGWIQFAIAGLALLSVPLAFSSPATGGDLQSARALGPAIVSAGFNVLIAAFFVWTGIATLNVSRWVRPVLLAAAKLWLVTGIATLVVWLFAAPSLGSLLAQSSGIELPPPVVLVLIVVLTGILALFYVALPLVLLRFFGSPTVRATFERRDPNPSAAERLPESVLAMTLTLALLAASALVAAPLAVFGCFGVVWTGATAALAWVVLGGGLAALAFAYGRLRPAGWWGTLAATLIATAGAAVTIERSDVAALLGLAGFPAEQIEAIEWMGLTQPVVLHALVGLSAFLVLVGLARTFRFFRSGSPL